VSTASNRGNAGIVSWKWWTNLLNSSPLEVTLVYPLRTSSACVKLNGSIFVRKRRYVLTA
jgi:hypothetical protein